MGSTDLPDVAIRFREHAYCARRWSAEPGAKDHVFYRLLPSLQPRVLQLCHPYHSTLLEYGWQLVLSPEDREYPIGNSRRGYDILKDVRGNAKFYENGWPHVPGRMPDVTGLYRYEFTGSRVVIHFDDPRPWPWPATSVETSSASARWIKDYLFGRLEVDPKPLWRLCEGCADNCKCLDHCPMFRLWEDTGAVPEEDPCMIEVGA